MNRNGTQRLEGRYKGKVINNIDPLQMGRVLVEVPDALGTDPCIWAAPAAALAGPGMGISIVPPIGAGVWVEFQRGQIDAAVWTGCWRGSAADAPPIAKAATPGSPPIILCTLGQHQLVLSDAPLPGLPTGGVMIQSGPSMLVISPDGVTITAPKIQINGLTVVNNGALTVNL